MTQRQSREGRRIPEVQLAELCDGRVKMLSSDELFAKRRVIVFALPGAFTPTCSTAHVPGYVARLKEFKDAGIDDVICLSVNDPYVMQAWQQSEKAEGIRFVADPFGEFTRAMGMDVEHLDNALGVRSWRYSMLVNDRVIEKMFIEPDKPGDPFEVSDADTLYRYLLPGRTPMGAVLMLARHGCPYCERAKSLLNERKIPFEAVHLGSELSMVGVRAAAGQATVPQIFIDGRLLGGTDKLQDYFAQRRAS